LYIEIPVDKRANRSGAAAVKGPADRGVGQFKFLNARRHSEGPHFLQRAEGSPSRRHLLRGRSLPPPEWRLRSGWRQAWSTTVVQTDPLPL